VIVGWAIDLKGRMPGLTAQLERMHMDLFGGEHQVLLLMDTLEGEETLYGFRGGRFCKRDGFYIYSNREVRNASVHVLPRAVPDENIQREAPRKNRSAKSGRRRRKRLRSYASSAAMLALALMLCRALYINYQKMNELEAALAVVREDDAVSGIAVEGVAGNIYKMPDTETANETDPVNEDTGTEPAQVDALSGTDPEGIYENAADIYLEQGYYVVQQGDSLAGICRKIYQTTDIMARICEANNIENADSIYVGQQLILPQ
jgi:nucleoid-associated protein YgaU